MERKLQEAFREFLENVPRAVCLHDKQGMILGHNSDLGPLLTGSAMNLTGECLFDLVPGELRKEMLQMAEDLRISREISIHIKNRDRSRGGRWSVSMDPVNGRREWILTTLRNMEAVISDADSDALNSLVADALLSTLSHPVFFKDSKFRFIKFNDQYLKIMTGGDDTSKLINKTVLDLDNIFDAETADEYIESDKRVWETGVPEVFEIPLTTESGGVSHYVINKSIFRHIDGSPAGLLGILTDITDRKTIDEIRERERQWMISILRQLPVSLFVIDRNSMNILEANLAGRRLLEMDESSIMASRDATELLFAHPSASVDRDHLEEERGKECILQLPDGRQIPVLRTLIEITHEGSSPQLICSMQDISTHRKLELQLMQSRKLESVGLLAAGLAHELNTPLQYIHDNVNFVKDGMDGIRLLMDYIHKSVNSATLPGQFSEKVREFYSRYDLEFFLNEMFPALDQTMQGIGQVTSVVKSLIEFSSPGTTKLISLDVNSAIDHTLIVMRNFWKYSTKLEKDLYPGLPQAKLNPGEFNQALYNLIQNAVQSIEERYGKEAGKKGRLSVGTSLDENSIVVRIRDNGKGIETKYMDKIFDPFYTTREVGKGTGQGLPLVHSVIVQKSGGCISVQNVDGGGVCVELRLPVPVPERGVEEEWAL